jgi:hypothetical protein
MTPRTAATPVASVCVTLNAFASIRASDELLQTGTHKLSKAEGLYLLVDLRIDSVDGVSSRCERHTGEKEPLGFRWGFEFSLGFQTRERDLNTRRCYPNLPGHRQRLLVRGFGRLIRRRKREKNGEADQDTHRYTRFG